MISAMERISDSTSRVEPAAFESDWVLQNAVIRELEILGEAAGRISRPFVDAHPEIPWKEITGLRHKLIHDYFAVDVAVVWRTATVNVPQVFPLVVAARDSLKDAAPN